MALRHIMHRCLAPEAKRGSLPDPSNACGTGRLLNAGYCAARLLTCRTDERVASLTWFDLEVAPPQGQRIVVGGHHRLAAAKGAGLDVPDQSVDPSTVIGPGQWNSMEDILQDTFLVGRDRLR